MSSGRGGDHPDMTASGYSLSDTPDASPRTDVIVVGGGISGLACARALDARGVPVRVLERSNRVGGRLSSPPLPRADDGARPTDPRPVDMGAAYFTVSDDEFGEQVADWARRDLARPWTDTLLAWSEGSFGSKPGPQRWAAPGGLRSLVADLAEGLRVDTGHTVSEVTPGPSVDGEPARAVVLAMPDPQAARLVRAPMRSAQVLADHPWNPVIAVALGYERRTWEQFPAAFVNDHPTLSLLADDGSRRGDDAPVLVAHTTGDLAQRHLDAPDGVIPAVVDAVAEVLGLGERPLWTHAHRWTHASPADPHDTPADRPFHLDDDLVAVVGDGWGSPKVETAWRSGTLLGRALAARLTC